MPIIDISMDDIIPPSVQTLLDNAETLIETVLDDVANSALLKWRQLAAQELRTSREEYLDSIQDIEVHKGERVISLVGWLAEAIETGLENFDLKVTLLRRGARTSQAGHRYRPIPLRHATPGTGGQAGPAMGTQYGPTPHASLATPGALSRGAAAALGKAVHKAAKGLKPGQVLAAGVGGAKKLAPHHATDLFAGMVKRTMPKAGGGKQTTGYLTFRMVSENPNIENVADKWLHPGIQARNFADKVADHAETLVAPAIRMAVNSALGGGS
jgi:hypothetical protein